MAADNGAPMEVRMAFLADAANVTDSGKLNVLGIFNRVFSDTFPYQHPHMQCVVRFEASAAEFGKTKEIEISLVNSDGKMVGTMKGKAQVPKPEAGSRASVELILGLNNVPFESPGDYEFSVLVGGEQKWSIPVEAVERKVEEE